MLPPEKLLVVRYHGPSPPAAPDHLVALRGTKVKCCVCRWPARIAEFAEIMSATLTISGDIAPAKHAG
jgi:hypothetical protein